MKLRAYFLSPSDREELREEMEEIGCDQEGLEIMMPRGLSHLIRMEGVPLRAALILKQELLARGGEVVLPQEASRLTIEQCNLLIFSSQEILEDLLEALPQQPYGLKEIGEKLSSLIRGKEQPVKEIKTNRGLLSLRERTLIMGILNLTPDSFSDGGLYLEREAAVERALEMEEEGADILDLGAESSRPGSNPLTLEEELERLLPVLEGVVEATSLPISVDTYKSQVAREALECGASMINDISGLHFDPRLAEVVAEYDVPVVIMHIRGRPQNMQDNPRYQHLFSEIIGYLEEGASRAQRAGLDRSQIIIDPGIGFGKTLDHNLRIIRGLESFKSLGYPLLLGTSRKSFIGQVLELPVDERLEGTAASLVMGIDRGAEIVRVHDVKEMARVVKMTDALLGRCEI